MENNFDNNENFQPTSQPQGSGYEGEISEKKSILKNKWLWIIVGVVLLVVIIFFSSVCFHEFSEATCTQPRTCRKCGKTEGSTVAHQYLDEATCTSPKTCWLCGVTEGEALGHDFKPATEYSPATCSRCGVETGEKLRSMKEWGFYDIDKFSIGDTCLLVQIYGYNFDEGFVVCDRELGGITLKDGWLRIVQDGVYDGDSKYSYDGNFTVYSGPYQYSAYDNNTIRWSGGEWNGEYGEHVLMITDRKTKNNNIILKCDNYWFVPYIMIDTSRPYEEIGEEGWEKWGYGKIKVYLKGY